MTKVSQVIYLYIKLCPHCDLRYFGRTVQDPYKYFGSGRKWKAHIKKHKVVPETLQVWSFTDQRKCTSFAARYSKEHQITESANWANLQDEDGTHNGACVSRPKTSEWIANHAASLRGFRHSEETKKKMSIANKGKKKPSYCRTTPTNVKQFDVIFPDGRKETISNLKKFCRENGLNYNSHSSFIRTRPRPWKGFLITKSVTC